MAKMTPFRDFSILLCILISIHSSASAPNLRTQCVNNCGPGHPACPQETRCIFSTCSYECLPVTKQDPRCPPSDSYGYCTDLCSHGKNNGCEEGFICCFNGCGNYCRKLESETT